MIKKINNQYFFNEEIDRIIDKSFPINHFMRMPGEFSYCKYLAGRWGVYILFDDENVLYIGLSTDLGSRLKHHFRNENYGNKIKSIGIIRLVYRDWPDGEAIENNLIYEFRPYYNKKIPYLNIKPVPIDFDLVKIINQVRKIKD